MDILDKAKDLAGSAVDKVGDLASGAVDKVGDFVNGVKESADSVLHPIDTLLGNWGSDMLEGAMKIANKTTFDIPDIKLVSTVTTVFTTVTTTFAICIVLFKVLEAQMQASNGSGEALTANILEKLAYSAIALAVLPWAMKFFITDIVAPIGEMIIKQAISTLDSQALGEHIRNFLVSTFFTGGISVIVLFVFLLFFALSIAKYFISICVFYADFIVLTMLTPLVAMSLLTDEQNYFQIWIKELLSESLTMVVKMALYFSMITLMLAEKYSMQNFMIMIGLGCVLIKTPSALQNMWYSTKVSKGGGIGNLAMLSILTKK